MVWRWSNDRIIHIDWTWDHGKVYTVIEYESGDKDVRENKEPPPTKACHDIAHFICAMHDDLEWDYELDPNHIVEYNAVFVEHLLIWFCHSYYHESEIDIKTYSQSIFDHMKWFAQSYYKIQEEHPSKKNYRELQDDFLNKVDFDILIRYFLIFYQTYTIENYVVCSPEFKLKAKLDINDHYEFEHLRNYLIKIKNNLLSRSYT
jgi:hypothetical protein|tara:strand:+ start:51 stop:662 length:612 start_codon:yes stop_codon:yes gene_type:complete